MLEVRLFKRLQIRQQITDLVRIELEGRHGRMPGGDAFGQRLAEGLDRIALVQRAERRRERLREEREKFATVAPAEAVAAFSEAFGRMAKNMIAWTVQAY